MSAPIFRFAPSPNGFLHLGHARSALINFDLARKTQGRLLLRIEDIDHARCRTAFIDAICQDLAWLGVSFDSDIRRQSAHLDDYRHAIARLHAQQLIYPSFESRAKIADLTARGAYPRDPDGVPLYPGTSKDLPARVRQARIAAGEPYALRLDMTEALARVGPLAFFETGAGPAGEHGVVVAKPEAWGDVVLARKELSTSYHVSVVIDDALQGVSHVVRGQDLFRATSIHRVLQALLGLPAPTYHHHELVRDASGRKLAKSTGATALRSLRARGLTPADIRHLVGLA